MQALDTGNDIMPEGVELSDWDDYPKHRQAIFDSVKSSVEKRFPQEYNGVKLELHEVHYDDPESYSLKDQKAAIQDNKFLGRRLRGTYRLTDSNTGEKLDEQKATLMRVPYLTERGTFIHNGSEYTTSRQARLLPGVYTRNKSNGEVESHFNAKRGTGPSFRVRLEPTSGIFKLDIGQSSLRLYSLLKDLGTTDEELEKRWGPELLKTNRDKYDARVFEKAYARLVRRGDPSASRDSKIAAIRNALQNTKLDRAVVAKTLPNLFNTKIASAWQQEATSADIRDVASKIEAVLSQNLGRYDIAKDLVRQIMSTIRSGKKMINPNVLETAIEAANSEEAARKM